MRSHVHIDDVAELFLLAPAKAPAGSFYYVENGEAAMKSVAQAIGRLLGLGENTADWPLEEAAKAWGRESAEFTFGSNSRVPALRALRGLHREPRGPPLPLDIQTGSHPPTP